MKKIAVALALIAMPLALAACDNERDVAPPDETVEVVNESDTPRDNQPNCQPRENCQIP